MKKRLLSTVLALTLVCASISPVFADDLDGFETGAAEEVVLSETAEESVPYESAAEAAPAETVEESAPVEAAEEAAPAEAVEETPVEAAPEAATAEAVEEAAPVESVAEAAPAEVVEEPAAVEAPEEAAPVDYAGVLAAYIAEKSAALAGSVERQDAIGDEWRTQKNLQDFYLAQGAVVSNVSIAYEYAVAAESEGSVDLNVSETVTVDYTAAAADQMTYDYDYTATLAPSAEGWAVSAISGTEANYAELETEGIMIGAYGIDYIDVSDETLVGASLEDLTEDSTIEALVGASYNATAAINYSNTWALKRNPAYHDYSGSGGDCANFVSQCLNAGGVAQNSTWKPGAVAWINNNSLRNYLVSAGYGRVIDNPQASQIEPGDLLFYNWSGSSYTFTNHVTICVGYSNGTPVINSHTSDRYHSAWNYGGSSTKYVLLKMNKYTSSTSNAAETESNKAENGIKMYRLYNPNSGEHFYTSNVGERNHLTSIGWRYEGVGWVAPEESGTPVYRLYNPENGDHHYTWSSAERDQCVAQGWKYEGIGWYSDDEKRSAVYREFNPNAKVGTHNYTQTPSEHEHLISIGWRDEGIGWYAVD